MQHGIVVLFFISCLQIFLRMFNHFNSPGSFATYYASTLTAVNEKAEVYLDHPILFDRTKIIENKME